MSNPSTVKFGTTSIPDPIKIGNLFLMEYYAMLRSKPEEMYKFYGENSQMNMGILGSKTTSEKVNSQSNGLAEINNFFNHSFLNKITETEIRNNQAILTNYGDGHAIMILVTGHITSNAFGKRPFSQSWFLAPQVGGYFLLNDLFQLTDGEKPFDSLLSASSTSNNNKLKENKSTFRISKVEIANGDSGKKVQIQSQPKSQSLEKPLETEDFSRKENVKVKSMKNVENGKPTSPVKQKEKERKQKKKKVKDTPKTQLEEKHKPSPSTWVDIVSHRSNQNQPQKEKVKSENIRSTTTEIPSTQVSIFIRGIPRNIREESKYEKDLWDMFSPFGTIKSVTVRAKKGIAFIDFENSGNTVEKILAKSNYSLNGVPIEVDETRGRGPRNKKDKSN